MKKSERIQTMLADFPCDETDLHPCYTGWFRMFNAGQYYEAHDVLEQLWLRTPGADHLFFKSLIQLAGAFVHLQKQHLRPWHAKDGRRLRPAARLFALAEQNLSPYGPRHLRLDVAGVCLLAQKWRAALERESFAVNPWQPDSLPAISLAHGG